MKLKELVLKRIEIPFKVSFKHSSADRKITQGIWIEAISETDLKGYGEGCPREYVTGESIDTAILFYKKFKEIIINEITSLDTLTFWIVKHKVQIDENPAAWCAIELAILDLISKEKKQSIEKTLELPEIADDFQYSAILGDSAPEIFAAQLGRYIKIGFTDFKIKLSGVLENDLSKVDLFRQFNSSHVRVRLDANNLWINADTAIDYLRSLNYSFFAIEEPLIDSNYQELLKIGKACNLKIILDESFIYIEDIEKIIPPIANWIVNLRISKMGGLIRSKAIVQKAKELSLPIIIGAQVGETSLLTRAALCIANYSRDLLIAQEGAFGTILLESDICDPSLQFGEKGLLHFVPSVKYGFQITVHANKDLLYYS